MELSSFRATIGGNPEAVRCKGLSIDDDQLYKYEYCARSFQLPYTHRGHQPGIKDQIIDIALNGSSIRDTAHVLRININRVMNTPKRKRVRS
jgi:transposase